MPTLMRLATARLFNTPLLVEKLFAETVMTVFAPRVGVQSVLSSGEMPPAKPARMAHLTDTGVLLLPIVGGLVHRGDAFDAECNGIESYTHLNNQLVRGLDDKDVKAILFDVDSPGGEAGGCFEFAETIAEARGLKPIHAIANTQACSAAYAIAASADKLYAAPSAHLGSIGVCWMHVDMSKALKNAGVSTTFVYAGAHKVDGNPFEPLPKEVRAEVQASIDATYGLFVDLVASRRPIDAEAVRGTEARVYRAEEAVALGLIDGIKSYSAVLKGLEQSALQPARSTHVITSSNPQETETMTTPAPAQPAAPTGIPKAEHDAAVTAAYARGRTDAGAILALPEAKGREGLVAELAADASITPERATAFLKASPAAAAPEKKGSAFREAMRSESNNPSVGTGEVDADVEDKTARRKELAGIAKRARA